MHLFYKKTEVQNRNEVSETQYPSAIIEEKITKTLRFTKNKSQHKTNTQRRSDNTKDTKEKKLVELDGVIFTDNKSKDR